MDSNYYLPWDKTDDNFDLWDKLPQYRWIHNKLELAISCGHNAGPIPILPKVSGYYCLRPIYNLIGLGLHAKKIWIDKDNVKYEQYVIYESNADQKRKRRETLADEAAKEKIKAEIDAVLKS